MGQECSKLIDSATVNYYSQLLALVKSADSTKVEAIKDGPKVVSIANKTYYLTCPY
jgi:hypothetical protein